jgi:tetratricopeptide (TPR) repeat protein
MRSPINRKKVKPARNYLRASACLAIAAFAWFFPADMRASELDIPPDATKAIDLMYLGKTEEAVALARKLEAARPDHPLGYLIEADVLWWNIYCKWFERKYNTMLALRYQKMPVARAGVEARKHLLRCLELDPQMADAYLGLGLYNYYVDTLSAMAKVLRFFMGIPGGDKKVGLHQLEIASTKGELTQVEARFNMARSLRNYDFDYARAEKAAAPLVAEYPENCIFLLLAGDIEQKLGHTEEAAAKFRAAAAAPWQEASCAERAHDLASKALASINANQ